jgi:hypothetical protein
MSGRPITAASHGGFTLNQIGGIASLRADAAPEFSLSNKHAANGGGE